MLNGVRATALDAELDSAEAMKVSREVSVRGIVAQLTLSKVTIIITYSTVD